MIQVIHVWFISNSYFQCNNCSWLYAKTDHLTWGYIAIDWMSKAGIATSCSAASASSNGASGIPAGGPTHHFRGQNHQTQMKDENHPTNSTISHPHLTLTTSLFFMTSKRNAEVHSAVDMSPKVWSITKPSKTRQFQCGRVWTSMWFIWTDSPTIAFYRDASRFFAIASHTWNTNYWFLYLAFLCLFI